MDKILIGDIVGVFVGISVGVIDGLSDAASVVILGALVRSPIIFVHI